MVKCLLSALLAALLLRPSLVRADGALEDAQLNAAAALEIGDGSVQSLERLVLKTAKGRASRDGDQLTLYLDAGEPMRLETDFECPPMKISHDNCVGYYLVADLPSHHAFVVYLGYYEGFDVWLVDDRTGRKTVLPAIPQFGPKGNEFITLDNHYAYGEPGITLWRWHDGAAEVIWRHGVELDPLYYEASLVRWNDPDVIQLELWSFEGPHWPAVARRGPGGWRLDSKWPKLDCAFCRNPDFK